MSLKHFAFVRRKGVKAMERQEIVIVDIRIPFRSMVALILKLTLAFMPAFLILLVFAMPIGLLNFI